VLVLGTPGLSVAQSRATSADLAGTILDESKAVLPGATLLVTHLDTGIERQSVSDGEGRFSVPALPPGSYRLRADLQGFTPTVVERVELTLGGSTSITITMMVGRLNEGVLVTAESPLVELERAVLATTVSREQIEGLPINGRNFISFSLIAPGVMSDRIPVQGATATTGLSFAGQRARSNNITVDGLDNNDSMVGSVRATFSQEAVQEFQVLTQGYTAEFGKASGGVVNIVTKSGGNVPAGSAFAYVRDDALNAKEYFERFTPSGQSLDQPKAPFGQKQWGGVFGGPIRRNRTFYFGSFERLDVAASNFVTIDPTAADVFRRAGFAVETGHVPYDATSNQGVFKVDHHFNGGHHLTLRYNFATGVNENLEPWGGQIARSRGGALDNRDDMFAGSHTSLVSSSVVHEIRFQVARRNQGVFALDPTCSGRCDADDEGGPTVEVSGVASLGRQRTTPQIRDNIRYQVLDTVSYQRGRHVVKAGIDVNLVDQLKATLPFQFGGRYVFTPLPAIPGVLPAPITAMQAFSLGLPAAYVQGYGHPGAEYYDIDVSAFVQDQWRVRDDLTVQGGVRYQRQFWQTRAYQVPSLGTYDIPADRNNIAPRVGVNWDPTGRGALSIHSAYGVYYDSIIGAAVGVPDIINGSTGVRTLVMRFPQSLAAWNAPGRRLPESSVGGYVSLLQALDPGLESSYSHQFSAGIDRDIGGITTVSANLVLGRGMQQLGTIDYNPLVPALGPGRRPEDIDGRAGTSASILQYTSYGTATYRGLSLSAKRRLSRGVQLLASYVLSKTEDNSTDFQGLFISQNNGAGRDPSDPTGLPRGFDPSDEEGPSISDQRHRFVFSGLFIAPSAVHVAGIVSIGSGLPFNILAGTDLNGDGDGGNFPVDRARTNPADPTTSVGRNAGRMPMEATVDLRVSRRWRLAGRTSIEPMFEVFNLLNRANFTAINNVFGTGAFPVAPLPGYGEFQRAAAPRQAQLAVKVVF
jgi:hypothetical protein